MKLLVVGSGAREHALVWKLAGERDVSEIVCAPGNAGMAQLARCVAVSASDPEELLALADHEQADLTVIGPELPLHRGVVNLFAANHRLVFGPTREAADIECSKAFAKEFMTRHAVPTARFRICDSAASAIEVLAHGEFAFPVVLKADGLASGKGVVVAADRAAADRAVHAIMTERRFDEAGARIVIEECLTGPEVSLFVMADGRRSVPLLSAQDHKRALDGDRGPNTGGMGAFAPSPLVDLATEERVRREIVEPVIEGLRAEGREFRGVLYAGLMLTREGPRVLEFNARFGDPETQVIVPLLDEELLPLLVAAATGRLEERRCRFGSDRNVGVVLASGGYPDQYETGKPISGLDEARQMPNVYLFHAGTTMRAGAVVTGGGRVLTVVGRGIDYPHAARTAYAAVDRIAFEGMHARRDIGSAAVARC